MAKLPLFIIEDVLKSGDYLFLNNGEVVTVDKYDKDRHRVTFMDGRVRDLYTFYDRFVTDVKLFETKESPSVPKIIDVFRDYDEPKEEKPTKSKKVFSIYALASGKPGKKFSIKSFLQITKEAKKKPGGPNTEKTIELDDGYVYRADSQQEIAIIKKLISHDSFKRLRGQCINIPYKYGRKTHNYYPDLILLTNTNKIIIVEIKELSEMNSKQNIRKYNALKRYCEQHGYLYLMCDKRFRPFEKLSKLNVNRNVENAIEDALDEKGYFDYSNYKELIEGKDHKKVKKIRDSIGIYVKSNRKVKMVGNLTFKSSNFRITYIKK